MALRCVVRIFWSSSTASSQPICTLCSSLQHPTSCRTLLEFHPDALCVDGSRICNLAASIFATAYTRSLHDKRNKLLHRVHAFSLSRITYMFSQNTYLPRNCSLTPRISRIFSEIFASEDYVPVPDAQIKSYLTAAHGFWKMKSSRGFLRSSYGVLLSA